LPDDDWKSGAEVQMKFADKHHVWVKESAGPEFQLIVVKRLPAAGEMDAPKPASVPK